MNISTPTPFNRICRAAVLAFGLTATALSWAADPVTDAMQAANAPYRVAMFKASGPSLPEAVQAVTQAQQAWDKFSSQFGSKPPAPYDQDAAFTASVGKVSTLYAQAQTELAAGQAPAAHTALKAIRTVTAEMRQRSQVLIYIDQIHAYHLQMEHVLIDGKAMLEQPKGLLLLTSQVGALSYLAKRLGSQAPANLAGNAEFAAMVEAVGASVSALETALLAQDMTAVKDAMGKLKAPYSKLFAKFG
jgi:hypothetical protein